MRRLSSPHIVRVYGIITSIERQLVLVMEFLPGGNLFKFVERHRNDKRPIEVEVWSWWARELQSRWYCNTFWWKHL